MSIGADVRNDLIDVTEKKPFEVLTDEQCLSYADATRQ
jgi:hypothetical protein